MKIRGRKISAMKLFSKVSTVTQATFNLESVKKTGYASDSERMLPRRKRTCKKRKVLYYGTWSIQNFINLAVYPCHADKRIQGWCARHCEKKKPHDFLNSLHRCLLIVSEASSDEARRNNPRTVSDISSLSQAATAAGSVSTFFLLCQLKQKAANIQDWLYRSRHLR